MSRGLSLFQKKLLEQLTEHGSANILQISTHVSYISRILKGDQKPSIWKYETVSDIRDVQKIYRMMLSLENRGLVARLLHRRPAVWVHISWENNKPKLTDPKAWDVSHVKRRDGQVQFRTKGQIWIMKDPNQTEKQSERVKRTKEYADDVRRWRRLLNPRK